MHELRADQSFKNMRIRALAKSLSGHSGNVLSCDVSRSGRWIASSGHDRTVKLWGCDDGGAVLILQSSMQNKDFAKLFWKSLKNMPSLHFPQTDPYSVGLNKHDPRRHPLSTTPALSSLIPIARIPPPQHYHPIGAIYCWLP